MRYLFLILLVPFVSAEIIINEIMYNPSKEQGNDKDLEWIEIYTDGEINLGDFYLYNLKLLNQTVENYFIITRNKTYFQNYYNLNLTVIESKFILSNKGGYINFTNLNQTYLVYYTNGLANGNGKTLEFDEIFYEGLEKGGTPGRENSIKGVKEYNIIINEFMAAPLDKKEWVELYNPNSEDVNLKGYFFSDLSNRKVYITTISGGTLIKANSYLVVNFQNTILMNNDGDEIRLINPKNKTIDIVSYDKSKKGFSWSRVKTGWLITNPSQGKKNYEESLFMNSSLKMNPINETKFGSLLNVGVEIYKGDTEKKSVYLYIKDLTRKTKVNVGEKFTNYSFSLPLLIDPNCNYKYSNKSYKLILEGLDKKYEESIKIEGIIKDLCKTKVIKENECNITETNLNNEEEIVYQSKDIKAERSALLFFCGLLILIILIQFKDGR